MARKEGIRLHDLSSALEKRRAQESIDKGLEQEASGGSSVESHKLPEFDIDKASENLNAALMHLQELLPEDSIDVFKSKEWKAAITAQTEARVALDDLKIALQNNDAEGAQRAIQSYTMSYEDFAGPLSTEVREVASGGRSAVREAPAESPSFREKVVEASIPPLARAEAPLSRSEAERKKLKYLIERLEDIQGELDELQHGEKDEVPEVAELDPQVMPSAPEAPLDTPEPTSEVMPTTRLKFTRDQIPDPIEKAPKAEADKTDKIDKDTGGMGPSNPYLMRQAGGRQPKVEAKPDIDESLSSAEKKLARLVFTTRGPEALKELQKSLKEGSKTSPEKHAAGLVHAEKMYSSEQAYFSELKKFQQNRGYGSVFMDKFFKKEAKMPEKLTELKDEWIKSRGEYASFMRSSAEESHKERHKRKTGKTGELLTGAVLDRYQRRVMLKEVLLGAEEAEQRARMEGLATRDKKGIEKLADRFNKLPKPARVLIGSALLGAGSAVAVAGGSVLGTVGLVMAVPSAIAAGIGMAQRMKKQKNSGAISAAHSVCIP